MYHFEERFSYFNQVIRFFISAIPIQAAQKVPIAPLNTPHMRPVLYYLHHPHQQRLLYHVDDLLTTQFNHLPNKLKRAQHSLGDARLE